VIVIDFNGTLVVKEPAGKYLKREILGTSGFKPSVIAAEALGKLCKDPSNVIYVVSGDSQQNLEVAVGDIAGLGLAASNGACYADPGERKWTYLNFGVDWQAVQKVSADRLFSVQHSIFRPDNRCESVLGCHAYHFKVHCQIKWLVCKANTFEHWMVILFM
jgi:hypothetical protein